MKFLLLKVLQDLLYDQSLKNCESEKLIELVKLLETKTRYGGKCAVVEGLYPHHNTILWVLEVQVPYYSDKYMAPGTIPHLIKLFG